MAVGQSNRIVITVDTELKRCLHSALARRGITLKAWFTEAARVYLSEQGQGSLQFVGKDEK